MTTAPKALRLAADYQCWPLWHDGPGPDVGNVDPATLPLAPATVQRLLAWARRFDAQLDLRHPGMPDEGGQPMSPAEHRAWIAEGQALAEQVQRELGPGCRVSFRTPR